MKYRITKITDKQGNNKCTYDCQAARRLGRIVDTVISDIMVGFPAILCCDNNHMRIYTTRVRRMSRDINSITLETKNSVYYLERVEVNNEK